MEPPNNRYSLELLLNKDALTTYEFEDEKLASTIYYTSFSTSLREIAIRKARGDNVEECEEENQWILGSEKNAMSINAINFDKLPSLCNADGLRSVDALIMDLDPCKLHFVIEFKRCSKQTMLEKYIVSSSDDSILQKLKDTRNLICNLLSIEGVEANSFLRSTHVIIVYLGKNNTVSDFQAPILGKGSVQKGANGKQNRASKIRYKQPMNSNPDLEELGVKIEQLGFAKCRKENFPVPGQPKYHSCKPERKIRNYSLFSSSDFIELIEKYNFFDSVNWGIYNKFFQKTS